MDNLGALIEKIVQKVTSNLYQEEEMKDLLLKEREDIEEFFSKELSTKEEEWFGHYEALKQEFSELSDDEYIYAATTLIQKLIREDEDYNNIFKELVLDKTLVEEPEELFKKEGVKFFNKDTNDKILSSLKKSKPSDHVYLDREADSRLIQMWRENMNYKHGEDNPGLPSDLFFSGTIPIIDCEITIDETEALGDERYLVTFRVMVYEDYQERIRLAVYNKAIDVGLVKIEYNILYGNEDGSEIRKNRGHIISQFGVLIGSNRLTQDIFLGYEGFSPKELKMLESDDRLKINQLLYGCLETWYGVQISLLHPVLKHSVIKNSRKEPRVTLPKSTKKKQKRTVRYIRRIDLSAKTIEEGLSTGTGYNRQTLVWYVMGHWRKRNDKDPIFIQGYWKGPLRDLKENVDDGRDRKIESEVDEIE